MEKGEEEEEEEEKKKEEDMEVWILRVFGKRGFKT